MSLFESASLVVTPNGTKASKLYAIKPTSGAGDLTVVRATTATRVNSAGLIESVAVNVPRLDYTNSTCPSILVEPQRTNSVLYSEQFDNAAWDKVNVTVTANNITSPDGTINADKIEYTNVNNYFITYSTNNQNTSYTISAYAKKGSTDLFSLREVFYFGSTARFDLTNGSIISDTTGTAKIQNVGNGWYRCSITQVYTSGQTNMQWSFDNRTSTGNLYLWGAQIEAGSYPTSYIPTVASAVTRNADLISKTGISSLIGQTGGTVFADLTITKPTSGNADFLLIKNATTLSSGVYVLFMDSNGQIGYFSNPSGAFGFINAINYSDQRIKLAYAYSSAGLVVYINGVQVFSNGSVTLGTGFSTLEINNSVTNAKISQSILFLTRLTNAELVELTTL